jgi:Holin of 3TMs, for gene-transfer release
MLPAALIIELVTGLMKGPITQVLDGFIKDTQTRHQLEADLKARLTDHLAEAVALQQAVVLAEVKSEHWLTRSWRPLLMCLLMAFLVLTGLVLPLGDLIIGHVIPFNPHWQAVPPAFWEFLTIGMGGYIGGRSLEKIAGQVVGSKKRAISDS